MKKVILNKNEIENNSFQDFLKNKKYYLDIPTNSETL